MMETLKELQTLTEFLILRLIEILKEFLKVIEILKAYLMVLMFQTWKACLTKKIQLMLSLY